jgi:cytidine deaminase
LLAWAAIEPKAPYGQEEPRDGFWALPDPTRGVPFSSPVFVLAERISDSSHDSALEILRRPIIVPRPLTLPERALIKVCCKRFRVDDTYQGPVAAHLPQPLSQFCGQPPGGVFNAVSRPIMIGRLPVHLPESDCVKCEKPLLELATGLKSAQDALTSLDNVSTTLGTGRVGAALIVQVDARVHVLRVAFNLPDVSHVLHAEYLLLRSTLAAGGADLFQSTTTLVTLISTRKPCRMCAAVILEVLGPNCQKVLYRHFDYGRMAARTVLNADSFDRSLMPRIKGEREEQIP